jgi:hypothetical protein
MRRASQIVAAALAVLGMAAGASPARASSVSESEDYIRLGVELRRSGKNREALDAFEAAYRLEPTPRAGAQIALAQQAMGDWVDAEQGLERALGFAADPWIALYRDALERALAVVRGHLGWLDVEANVSDGELLVDGTSRHDLPSQGPVRVTSGSVEMDVRAPGFLPVHRSVDVAPGARVQVVVALESMLPPPPPSSQSPSTGQTSLQRPAVSSDVRRVDVPSRIAGYAPFAGAVVFAGAGIISWRVRENEVGIYNDDSRCLVGTLTREQQCESRAKAANIALAVEIGAFAAAGASAALGAWRLWHPGASSSRIARASCAPWAGLGMSCEGRF